MKYSDYLTASPSPTRIQQTVTVRDENREAILEQQVDDLNTKVNSHKDQQSTIDTLKRQKANLDRDKRELSSQLDEASSALARVSAQLEKQESLKETIKFLTDKSLSQEKNLDELQTNANTQEREITNQQEQIMQLTIDKHVLEDAQGSLQQRTKFAEQKHTDLNSEIKFVKGKFTELEEINVAMKNQYDLMQSDLNNRIEQCSAFRKNIEILEDEIKKSQSSNISLHDSLSALQSFYSETKDELTYSTSESSRLETTVASLMDTINHLEEDNTYLLDKKNYLEAIVAKPKYMSQSLIERQEGFKMPLASGALNIRKNYLGTGKPTLLKFKKKELSDDNN